MELAPGTVFASDYEVQRALSEGGMGRVYVVLQRSTGKQRALKLMLPQLVSDPALRRRFEQEARVASLIESDHVVEVVGAGIDEASGAPWLAMELLKGGELTPEAIAASGQPLAATHTILRQVCHAVGAAHAAGIVHRDLKPENIFLAESKRAGEQRTVKVLDFGIAKIAAEASTQHTAAMGSPIWMAPEQTDKGAITPAADVWALGLVTYNLLTGKFFWHSAEGGGTIHQVMKEVLFEPIPPASQRAAEQGVAGALPPWFDAWLAGCLNRDPAQRYPDANAMFAAFDRFMNARSSMPVAPTVMAIPTVMQPPISHTPTPQAAVSMPPPQVGMTAPGVVTFTEPPARRRPVRRILGFAFLAVALFFGFAIVKKKVLDGFEDRVADRVADKVAAIPADSDSADDQEDSVPDDGSVSPSPTLSVAHLKHGPTKVHRLPPSATTAPSAVPSGLTSAIASEAANPPPPPPQQQHDDGDFPRSLAVEKVTNINLQMCANVDGAAAAAGTRAFAVYDNDGQVDDVNFEFAGIRGTPAARCVERRLIKQKDDRVPSFHGQKRRVIRMLF